MCMCDCVEEDANLETEVEPSLPDETKKYAISITWSEEDQAFLVRSPDLPGLLTQGETLEHCIEQYRDALECYLEGVQEISHDCPRSPTEDLTLEDLQRMSEECKHQDRVFYQTIALPGSGLVKCEIVVKWNPYGNDFHLRSKNLRGLSIFRDTVDQCMEEFQRVLPEYLKERETVYAEALSEYQEAVKDSQPKIDPASTPKIKTTSEIRYGVWDENEPGEAWSYEGSYSDFGDAVESWMLSWRESIFLVFPKRKQRLDCAALWKKVKVFLSAKLLQWISVPPEIESWMLGTAELTPGVEGEIIRRHEQALQQVIPACELELSMSTALEREGREIEALCWRAIFSATKNDRCNFYRYVSAVSDLNGQRVNLAREFAEHWLAENP